MGGPCGLLGLWCAEADKPPASRATAKPPSILDPCGSRSTSRLRVGLTEKVEQSSTAGAQGLEPEWGCPFAALCLRLPRPPVRFQRGRPWGGPGHRCGAWAAGAGRRLARPPNFGLTASLAERADRQCLWSAKRPEAVRYSPVRLEDQDEGRAVQRK